MKTVTVIVAALLAAALCSCGGPESSGGAPKAEVILAGSTSVQPFADLLAEKYHALKPNVTVTVQGGGSSAGIKAVRGGAAMIGMSSRELTEEEKDLTPIVIAHDGIALIVHTSNPVGNLTLEQIRGIFSGKITDWNEVGGTAGPVRPVTREAGSGTRTAFTELVMKDASISNAAVVQNSNGAVREVISKDQQGIGYISMGLVDQSVKAAGIDGVAADEADVVSGQYKLVRPFLFVTKGPAQGAAKEFIEFVLGDEGQKILESEHLIRAKQ